MNGIHHYEFHSNFARLIYKIIYRQSQYYNSPSDKYYEPYKLMNVIDNMQLHSFNLILFQFKYKQIQNSNTNKIQNSNITIKINK